MVNWKYCSPPEAIPFSTMVRDLEMQYWYKLGIKESYATLRFMIRSLYELRIDYDTRTDYGYEVNYKLYNYFVYFQMKYKQQLSTFIPRI